MKHYIEVIKTYTAANKKKLTVITSIVGGVIVLGVIGLLIYNSMPKIVYQPARACSILSPNQALNVLNGKIINVGSDDPVFSGNTAISKCSYTDSNPDENAMMVVAIAIRSGINDAGVKQNKADFTADKPSTNTETVTGLGNAAYFNQTVGQLDILTNHDWIILSYGVGATPAANNLDKTVALAHQLKL